jgi:putative oxidoreductase
MTRRTLMCVLRTVTLVAATATGGCVQAAYDRTVVYRVDVSALPNVSSVGLRGEDQPLSWDQDTPMMPVPDSAGLYTATVTTRTGRLITDVKFVVNGRFEFSDAKNQENRKVPLPRTTAGGDTLLYRAVFNQR